MKTLATVAPFSLAEVSKPVQVLRTGRWRFPDYGEVEIGPDDLQQYADNFKRNVRRQKLPVVIEHNHELGSYGWVRDMFVDGDALYAQVDWTERGADLVQSEAFKYISGELFPEWEDPESQTVHKNVPSAISITNFPRIKNMREIEQIAAGERLPYAVDLAHQPPLSFAEILIGMRSQPVNPENEQHHAPTPAPAQTPPTPHAEGVTPAMFAELQAQLKTKERQFEQRFAEQEQRLAEAHRLLGIERQTRILLECSEKVEKAKREGRITPAQADHYLAEAPKMSDEMRDFLFSDIASRPATAIPLGEVGTGAKPEERDTESKEARDALAARQKQIFAEAKKAGNAITMREALLQASRELREGK